MDFKKLITFFLLAFLPVAAIGWYLHSGDTSSNMMLGMALTSVCMFFPLLAVVITQLIFKEPVLGGLGISFKINRWWFIGWLLMPVFVAVTLGITLLMPGAKLSTDNETLQLAFSQLPAGLANVRGFVLISVVSGMFAGITINALLAFGEEIAWRGFLMKLFKGKSFITAFLSIGFIWGLWHAPIILNGHNYPDHPGLGIFMMIVFCILLTPILMYFRKKSGSVIVPAIMHGTINALAGINLILVSPSNELLYGCTGLAGFIALLLINICLYIYDTFISKES